MPPYAIVISIFVLTTSAYLSFFIKDYIMLVIGISICYLMVGGHLIEKKDSRPYNKEPFYRDDNNLK